MRYSIADKYPSQVWSKWERIIKKEIMRPAPQRRSAHIAAFASYACIETLEQRQHLSASSNASPMTPPAVSTTDVLAQISNRTGLRTLEAYIKKHPASKLARSIDLKKSSQLFRTGHSSTLLIKLKAKQSPGNVVKLIQSVTGVNWASPNYIYGRGRSEVVPNDPRWTSQSDVLNKLQLPQAWDVTTGNAAITVAVLDDGLDKTLPDLQQALYTNPGEIAGNGIDDDANGYIDDIHGWDFASHDNDVTPAYNTQYNFTDAHGTTVASTIGAAFNNATQIAGIAGGVKVLPVRFYGFGATTTSAGIAQSIAYAANMGARVMNLSFSIDPYQEDPAFYAATDLAYDRGVLWINSAGNANVNNPPRVKIEKALFVANVDKNDIRNPTSNFGTGIDIAAPGTDIPTIAPGNQTFLSTGTSFASAVTSGVAALIWSAHPTWTRDQVAAQLIATADSINHVNPTFVDRLGAGRVNAFRGVSENIAPPTVRGTVGINDGDVVTTQTSSIVFSYKNILDASTVNSSAFELRSAGPDGSFDTADDVIIPMTRRGAYSVGTNQTTFVFSTLVSGRYRFSANDTITDPFGTALDGDNDGIAGGKYVRLFNINPQPPAAASELTASVTAHSSTEAIITWKDNSIDESSFVLERSLSADFSTIDVTKTIASNQTKFWDWGLRPGKTYYYRIRALNAIGASINSNVAVLELPALAPGLPAAPTDLTATAPDYSLSEVELRWTDESNNELEFVIQRATDADFIHVTRTFNATANSTRYNDWGLMPGVTYFYRIQSINNDGLSESAPVIQYDAPQPTLAPPTPLNFRANIFALNPTEVELRWDDSSNLASGYVIERSVTDDFADVTLLNAAAGTSRYNDWGRTPGVTYFYRIKATNIVGTSETSAVVFVTV
jgi:subtilisin family serine protease